MENTEEAQARRFPDRDPGVVLKVAMDRLQTQQQQVDSLDGKIGNLLGFGSALLAIFAGFLALREDPIPGIAWALLSISGLAYITIVAGSLYAYYTRRWEAGPKLDETWQYARECEEKQVGWWAAESFTKCYENNQDKVKWKIWIVKADVALIAVETITLAIGLALIA